MKAPEEVSDEIDYLIRNSKYMLVILGFLFNEEAKKSMSKKTPVFEGTLSLISESGSDETNMLIAIQSKIFEFSYRRTEVWKREQFLLCFIKSAFRVFLKKFRETEYSSTEESKQILIDLAFISELFNELVDKEDESIVSGFYHLIANALKDNTIDGGDPSVPSDKLLQYSQRKRSTFKLFN